MLLLVPDWTMVTLCCMGLILAYWISYSAYKILQHGFLQGPRNTSNYEHISPILAKLHWLPVCSRIEYKILLLTFRALNNIGPQYIRDLLNIYTPPRNLRSIDKHVLVVPNSKMKTAGDRAFSCIAPRLWNGLPEDIKSSRTLENFKSKLKTYLFKKSFNV